MNKVLIGILIGIGSMYLYKRYRSKKTDELPEKTDETIGLGDKGKEVAQHQENINFLLGHELLEPTGTYDKDTMSVTADVMGGTSYYVGKNGMFKKGAVNDMSTIINNVRNFKM